MDYRNFVGGAYASRSVAVAAETCENLFVERVRADGSGGRAELVLHQSPGYRLFAMSDDGSDPRYIFLEPATNRVFVIFGRKFCELLIQGGSYLGTVANVKVWGAIGDETPSNTVLGRVSMATNGRQILIVSEAMAFVFDVRLNTLAPVLEAPFSRVNGVGGAGSCTYMDGYFIVTAFGTRQFFYSSILDGTTGNWSSLDVASKEGAMDGVIVAVADHRELLLFGAQTTEPFYDSGGATNPFAPIPGTFIEQGLVGLNAIVKADNALFFLGMDKLGAGIIYRLQGYKAQRVSTHAIEWIIQQYPRLDDVVLWAYQEAGHTVVVCCFPSGGEVINEPGGRVRVLPGGATWAYDCATQVWHRLTHLVNGIREQYAGRVHGFAFNKHLIGGGDGTGKLYWQHRQFMSHDGDLIRRERAAPVVGTGGKFATLGTLQLDLQVGVLDDTGCGECKDIDNPFTITMVDANGISTQFDTNLRTVCTTSECVDKDYTFTVRVTDSHGQTATGNGDILASCTDPNIVG